MDATSTDRGRKRPSRLPPWGLLIGGLAVILALGFIELSFRVERSKFEPEPVGYRLENDGRTLVVVVVDLHAAHVITTAETSEDQLSVKVRLVARLPFRQINSGGPEFRDVRFELDAPLGARRVLYGAAGIELTVYPP